MFVYFDTKHKQRSFTVSIILKIHGSPDPTNRNKDKFGRLRSLCQKRSMLYGSRSKETHSNNRMKKKSIVLAFMLTFAWSICALAQGGLFQRGTSDGNTEKSMGLLRNGETTNTLTNQGFGNPVDGSDLTNQTFGSPIGSGLLVMLMAGAGYAALKKNKKNNK